jgi:hypothetical protein
MRRFGSTNWLEGHNERDDDSAGGLERSRISLAVVLGGIIVFVNVTSAVMTLFMAA